jgi:hypothetical protein
MAEESSFFNSVNGDRQYDMEQFATYFKQFLSTGIFHKDNVPYLKVKKGAGLQTILETGSAYVEGFMYRNTEEITFSHDAADATNPRIDRIILRLDRGVNARNIKAMIKKGTPATNPLPPALQRDDIVYELSLAQARINAGSTSISTLTDERLNESVAGLVNSLITIPTDEFQQQWNSYFNGVVEETNQNIEDNQAEWDNWFSGIQEGNPAMGGMKISVNSTEPTSPVLNDIWIDTND